MPVGLPVCLSVFVPVPVLVSVYLPRLNVANDALHAFIYQCVGVCVQVWARIFAIACYLPAPVLMHNAYAALFAVAFAYFSHWHSINMRLHLFAVRFLFFFSLLFFSALC